MKPKYLLVLHNDSVAGSAFAAGTNDGKVMGNPAIYCTDVDPSGYLIRAEWLHPGTRKPSVYWFPQASIALIAQLEKDAPKPIGFVPNV